MLRITKKRTAVIAGAAALVLAGTTAAFAYWTTSGSGSGSASVASSAHTVTLHATTSGNLYPGASVPVSFTADNASSGGLQVNKVQLVSVTADTAHASCTVADFTMADVLETQTIAAGASGIALTNGGTLAYADTAVDQSTCKGATLTLTVSSN
jgi:hypothetical protein